LHSKSDREQPLPSSDRNHGVHRLKTSLHWLVDGLAGQDARGLDLSTATLLGVERALAIDGVTESVDNTAKKLRTDWDIDLEDDMY
jgi:hypothetical protein